MAVRLPVRAFEALATATACLAAGLAAASLLAGLMPAFDLVNQAAPLPLAMALSGVIGCVAAHRGRVLRDGRFWAFAFAAAAFAALVLPDALRALKPPLAPQPGAAAIRVISHNIHEGSPDIARTRTYLQKQDADFVALYEVTDADLAALAPLRRKWPYWTRCNSWPYCRVYILSRTPPLPNTRETPTGPFIARRNRHYPLYSRLAAADYRVRGEIVRVIAAHVRRPPSLYAQRRDLRLVLSELRRTPRRNVVLMGDFNLTPWTHAIRDLDARSGLIRRTQNLATWPSALPIAPIDHIYASPTLTTLRIARGPRTGSDHRPVEADFALTPDASR
ncbi:MAG: hypothetical protein GC189_00240 [Alphaproteobacteria bacterium]|nr:hypothetical protein [Alphaproteobacteria bacterium]